MNTGFERITIKNVPNATRVNTDGHIMQSYKKSF